MTKDEALDLALEWQAKDWNTESPMAADNAISEANDVINALVQVLAAPVPENFIDALRFDVAMRDAAQRQWVGLTRKEVYDLYDSDYGVFYQRIAAKLKEKNT